MSRSFKHTPIMGLCGNKSEKQDKAIAHRRERSNVRVALAAGDDLMPHQNEMGDPWTWAKDGKRYFGKSKHPKAHEWLRK